MQKYAGAYSKEFEEDFKHLQAVSPQSSSDSSSVGKKSETDIMDDEGIVWNFGVVAISE